MVAAPQSHFMSHVAQVDMMMPGGQLMPPPPPVFQDHEPAAAQKRRSRRRQPRVGGFRQDDEAPVHEGAARAAVKAFSKSSRLRTELEQVDWMLREFKTAPCALEGILASHDHRCCPHYHNERDRRRPAVMEGSTVALYVGEPCADQFDDQRVCERGDACTLCHSTAELLYHPNFFRKRLCHQAHDCPRGRFCAFAHTRQELLVPHFTECEEKGPSEDFIILRFKTQWCPVGGPHDWEACVYAHTYRDWRRVPTLGYTSHPCPRWASSVAGGPAELSYADRCPHGFACPLAHGAKEQLYHPQFYKTSPCSDSNCRRGPLCAFTHGFQDARRERQDDPSQRLLRKPIPQAEQLLAQCQPTFSAPPMYHALEDAPKGYGNQSKSRNRRARGNGGNQGGGGGGAARNAAPAMTDAGDRIPSVPFYPPNSVGLQHSPVQMATTFPQYLCHWVAAPHLGYGQQPMLPHGPPPPVPPLPSVGGVTSSCYPSPLLWNSGAPQYLLALPPQGAQPQLPHSEVRLYPSDSPVASPSYHEPPSFFHEPEETPAVSAAGSASTGSVLDADLLAMPSSALLMRRIVEQQQREMEAPPKLVNLAAWRQKYCFKEGWRTPSSFGSPPLSGAPTAASSPRMVEPSSWASWGDGSQPDSTEDATREALVTPRCKVHYAPTPSNDCQ